MTLGEALEIMGEPDETRYGDNVKIFYYEPPLGASDWITFEIDTSKKVVNVNPFKSE